MKSIIRLLLPTDSHWNLAPSNLSLSIFVRSKLIMLSLEEFHEVNFDGLYSTNLLTILLLLTLRVQFFLLETKGKMVRSKNKPMNRSKVLSLQIFLSHLHIPCKLCQHSEEAFLLTRKVFSQRSSRVL